MFTDDIFPRLLAAVLIIGAGTFGWWLSNRLLLRRARQNTLPQESGGVPSLLYFTTATCAPCKTFQRPAIERLKQTLGGCLNVVEIDATAQPELARQWGVLSVPTTFVLDGQGTPRHVNHGPTGAEKLLQQIKEIS
ncbi:MAG: thioredoxin family protein [Chloroflexota bacterium]